MKKSFVRGEEESTDISNIIQNPDSTFLSFYDRIHNPTKKIITMYDMVSMQSLPQKTKIRCFWCRNRFQTAPLGCPVKMMDSELIEKWVYRQNGEYTLEKRTKVSQSELEDYKTQKDEFFGSMTEEKSSIENSLTAKKAGKFLVTKIFCSFNCAQAFINEELEKNNFIYKDSTHLLANMYKFYTGEYPKERIPPAPSYELLKEYGGKLTIDQFRKSFSTTTYKKVESLYVPAGSVFSEEVIF